MHPELRSLCYLRRMSSNIFKGFGMKKVSGYISVRALGCYDFTFYVDDNATDEEIETKVEETMQLSHDYSVEPGYEEYTETYYRKKR